nr:MAG TPA: hypothetical protein [Caudoviricetes sp.]
MITYSWRWIINKSFNRFSTFSFTISLFLLSPR